MPTKSTDLAWRVGGPQGSGVDTAATMFARACAAGGLHVFGRREYYSNIMGRHSYYDVRVAPHEIACHRDRIDLLTTFEVETLARHAVSVVEGGGILYNAENADTPLSEIPYLDRPLVERLTGYLRKKNLPASTDGLLEDAKQRGVAVFAIPYAKMTSELSENLGIPQSVAERTLNTIAVAVSTAFLGFDPLYVKKAIARIFAGRDKIIGINDPAVDLAYRHAREDFDKENFRFTLAPADSSDNRLLVNANQASALGKLAAGMTCQTYYPISPATDESVFLEAHESFPTTEGEEASITVVQTEDELAAITMAIGSALTGARSSTATSGPGFSLMAEALGWAGINEVPLVVSLYQRGGPSTGMPTRSEQGDLQFALSAGHGDFPRIVLASSDVTEAFYDAAQAFNYAERYQTPVIHLLDKAMSSTTQTVPPFDVSRITIERGKLYQPSGNGRSGEDTFARFKPTESGISTRAVLGQPGGAHWLTGGEHTEIGRVTEDPSTREEQMEKRARKLETAAREIPEEEKLRVYGDPKARFTLISWGSNKGGILEAMRLLEAEGISARLIQVRLLWPFPAAEVERLLETAEPLVAVESNFTGQFARLLRESTGTKPDHLVVKYNGRPISGSELAEALGAIREGGADARLVLRNPYE